MISTEIYHLLTFLRIQAITRIKQVFWLYCVNKPLKSYSIHPNFIRNIRDLALKLQIRTIFGEYKLLRINLL